MSEQVKHFAILIIAAGQSKRLGQPKQLLTFEGESLINRLVKELKHVTAAPITLVLGAYKERIESQLHDSTFDLVYNDSWEEGMASSIRVGVSYIIKKNALIDGIMILVCDQPYLSYNHIQSLFTLQHQTGKPIVASSYNNIIGTPVLFHKRMFPHLLALQGEMGAKKIINEYPDDIAILPFEKGSIDIDTIEDYHNLVKEVRSND